MTTMGRFRLAYAIVTPSYDRATVTSTVPAMRPPVLPINQKVIATFSESMDPSTISTTTFTLTQGSKSISGAVTYAGTTATFTPTTNLEPGNTYTRHDYCRRQGRRGKRMARNFVWTSRHCQIRCAPGHSVRSSHVALGAAALTDSAGAG